MIPTLVGGVLFLQSAALAPLPEAPPLPRPLANNAVAAVRDDAGWSVYTALGLDTTTAWSGVVSWAFRWRSGTAAWEELPPVPGPGRLAATAEAVAGQVYVFGGYTVAEDGTERSLPAVDRFDPATGRWSAAAPMPLPVDDAVSGVWRDSLVILVSGWHDTDNVPDVQIYDPAGDAWQAATPIPGPPVFGHAGAVVGNTIVYIGGTATHAERPRFRIEPSAWRGDIDPDDPAIIRWRRLPAPPGPPRYRAAGGAVGSLAVFVGGTDNPYNYTGVGYDGRAAQPLADVIAYDVASGAWLTVGAFPVATMDHRAVLTLGDTLVVVGGMEGAERVTARTQRGHLRRP
jgi:N-acetylneuraminic acid mutarotase